jgi:hypothetical protein
MSGYSRWPSETPSVPQIGSSGVNNRGSAQLGDVGNFNFFER